MFFRRKKQKQKAKPKVSDPLDTPLLSWSEHDRLTVRGLLNGGVAILGATGSGKSSSSGRLLARSILAQRNNGGLWICAKPDDAAHVRALFAEASRLDDLVVFSPEENWRFNFLDYEMRRGGHTRNIVKLIMTIGETLRAGESKGTEDAAFWEMAQERMLYNAVQILKVAFDRVDAPTLQRFIMGAAHGPEEIGTSAWRDGFHNQCIKAAYLKPKSPVDEHDCRLAFDYWLSEYVNMAPKTRSSIEVGVNGTLHVFNTGIVRSLVSDKSNISPDDMCNKKWVMVDMCPSEWGELGKIVNSGWKYLTQQMILRREPVEGDPIVVIFSDEAQEFLTSVDSSFLARCRSHYGCMCVLTQSISSLYAVLKGPAGRHQADSLLGNFGHLVVHACDPISADWASQKLGKSLETFIGGSMAPSGNVWDELVGKSQYTANFSEHYEPILQPNVFMNGLRTGGKVNGLICDGIVIRNGRPFSNGQNYLRVAFSQK